MEVPKGSFNSEQYNQENNVLQMDGWIAPTLVNIGANSVIILGQEVLAGEAFVIGAGVIELYGNISLKFPTTTSLTANANRVLVNYIRLEKTCK